MLDLQLYRERLEASAARFREFFGDPPDLAIVFGSGLGKDFLAKHPEAISLPFSDFPEFKIPQVEGHHARICSIREKKKNSSFVVLQGRVHHYEGYEASELVFPVRTLALWGVKRLLLTNASGSIRESLKPGQLAMISDHLNFMGVNPLTGPNLNYFGTRFPSLQTAYRNSLSQFIRKIAKASGIKLKQGVYVGIAGPSYETDAEVRAYRRLGGDLIGMSTVLEAIAATHAGMEVAALAAVSNSCLKRKQPLNHGEVLQHAEEVDRSLAKLLEAMLKKIGNQ